MRGLLSAVSHVVRVAVPVGFLAVLLAPLTAPVVAQDSDPELVAVFADGFESAECAQWSASSNPLAAPDVDSDTFGDANQPTVVCQLPLDFVFDARDCNDLDPAVHPGAFELCNGIDDDCDANSADGGSDPQVGLSCDGADSDLCLEGATACVNAIVVCDDTTDSTIDICNGLDDDCDAASADGSEDPQNGVSCDGADSDLCIEGATTCVNATLACSDTTGSTIDICNGLDDDCDGASADGSEDPQNGVSCDGADSDLCAEGNRYCSSGSLACSDTTGTTIDICNGLDDDCDAASADGSEDPQNGVSCDGADSDLCAEGNRYCSSGSLACSDTTGTTIDICNGLDDDCDAASADGSEDPMTGVSCDGADGDFCLEGTYSCLGGSLFCSDLTGTTVEICNGFDDDCDGSIDEGCAVGAYR